MTFSGRLMVGWCQYFGVNSINISCFSLNKYSVKRTLHFFSRLSSANSNAIVDAHLGELDSDNKSL